MRTAAGGAAADDDDFADMAMDEASAVASQPKPIGQVETTELDTAQQRRGAKTPQEWEERQEFLDTLLTLDMHKFAMTVVFRRLPEEMQLAPVELLQGRRPQLQSTAED